MLELLADPRVQRYLPSNPPTDLESLRARYGRLESRCSPDGQDLWLNWTVFADSQAVGTVQATVRVIEGVADVAYVFGPVFWRQGFANEALYALLCFLPNLDVGRARANLDTRNRSSARLVERLGFVRVSELRGADKFKGEASNEYVYERRLSATPPPT